MIKIGQIVVTKNSGVCKIITEEEMNFGAGIKNIMFYVQFLLKINHQKFIFQQTKMDYYVH